MYFRGAPGTPERESDVAVLIDRVVNRITAWGDSGRYFRSPDDREAFREELKHLVVHQKASFNSPVWFNCGYRDEPQCSACFIISVEDSMESILELAKTEGMLFKHGSGTGSNLSGLRGSREMLDGGCTASGPVSFMKGFDAFAGVIKSGGACLAPAQAVYTEDGPVRAAELADPQAVQRLQHRPVHVLHRLHPRFPRTDGSRHVFHRDRALESRDPGRHGCAALCSAPWIPPGLVWTRHAASARTGHIGSEKGWQNTRSRPVGSTASGTRRRRCPRRVRGFHRPSVRPRT